ncbi:hypothetical protein T09_3142 [Trichinella sp. T9]|nr:hypothetical protein T09_3142 [Trichinella sp. T9]
MTPCQVFLQNRFYLTAATLWCITVKIIAKNGWTIPCIFFKKYCAYSIYFMHYAFTQIMRYSHAIKFQSNRLSLNEFVTMFLLFKTASEEGILKLNFYNLLLWLKVDAIEFHVTLS